ncbi:amidase signature domain-containing protein [Cercophora samala]|uniref:Amidase signature domain-containing protein n=1 Tax=Cercophora samala TaxID=330535 RepID=A0AA39YZ43_9PEZI|nr:amidase signature domain-containing protein [Cercophora samala]
MENSAGSYCLLGSRTGKEASVVGRLGRAGAVILGTTNLSEWGNSRSSGGTAGNGWSAVGGQTEGVYYRGQDPCGSSSGSGVAVALGLGAGAVGVETVGSITCPAMRSNLVSIKTTSGLVARDGVIVTKLRGSVGPMTRTVGDAAVMLTYMTGRSEDDPGRWGIPFSTMPDYTRSLKLDGLLNSRLAVPRNNVENPWAARMNLAPVMEQFDRALDVMRGLGATIIDNANYSSYAEINAADAPQGRVGPSEYRFDMENYFRSLMVNPHNIETVEDLINCTKALPEEEFPSRDIAYWEQVVNSADFTSPEMAREVERMRELGGKGGIDGVLDTHWADAIVFPSVCSSDVPGLVGYPVICVPLGFMPEGTEVRRNLRGDLVEEGPGIPFGLSFIGKPFTEERLIELAYAFEQHTLIGRQRRPVVLPTVDLCDTLRGKGVAAWVLGKLWRGW